MKTYPRKPEIAGASSRENSEAWKTNPTIETPPYFSVMVGQMVVWVCLGFGGFTIVIRIFLYAEVIVLCVASEAHVYSNE